MFFVAAVLSLWSQKQNHDHLWEFQEQDLAQELRKFQMGDVMVVPFLKLVVRLIKNLDQLLVKICWEISSMISLSEFLFGYCACILFIN